MTNRSVFDEFPSVEGDDSQPDPIDLQRDPSPGEHGKESRLMNILEGVSRAGLGETVFRAGSHLLSIALVLAVVWGMRTFYRYIQQGDRTAPSEAALAAPLPTSTPTDIPADLPDFPPVELSYVNGIPRLTVMHTTIPTRPRTDVITYTVQKATRSSARREI
jgi:hypothetical protein